MVTVFTSSSCALSRKAKHWLDNHEIPYEERNTMFEPMAKEELKSIMALTEDGIEDIISTDSEAFKELDVEVDDLSIRELLELAKNNTAIIKSPIIMDDKRIQIGYSENEMKKFIPREIRTIEVQQVHGRRALTNA